MHLHHAPAVLLTIAIAAQASFAQNAVTIADGSTGIGVMADAKAPGKPLAHFWSRVVGAGRANEGLRATWQEELHTAAAYDGFQYVRFHGLFHDDMFVYREDKDEKPIYNFQYVDDLFDRMLSNHVRPFVELSFMPSELAVDKGTVFWWKANGSTPTDIDKWTDLVRHFVAHCTARYGGTEVETWYFEVWNEPNLKPFFNGTQQQYFELYKATALAIKGIDPKLKIGGPATSNFEIDQDALKQAQISGKPIDPLTIPWKPLWIEEFLNYCRNNQLPVDFVSTHPYPQDFAIDEPGMPEGGRFRRSVDSTRDDLRTLRKIIDAGPYPKAEIQLTEWSSSPSPLDHTHDSLAAAAFIVKTNLESVGLVDSLSYWVFTDVFEENRATDSIFHGGFGLINYQQVVKPAFHAYRFLNQLGDVTLQQAEGGIVTRDSKSNHIAGLFYNYPPEMKVSLPVTLSTDEADKTDTSGSARRLNLKITHLAPNATFTIETLDRRHGDAVAVWEAMGRPDPPGLEQTKRLRREAWATKHEEVHADSAGNLVLRRWLDAWSVVLIKQM